METFKKVKITSPYCTQCTTVLEYRVLLPFWNRLGTRDVGSLHNTKHFATQSYPSQREERPREEMPREY
jgi:hypothetical protein